jgi:hypothetical protein
MLDAAMPTAELARRPHRQPAVPENPNNETEQHEQKESHLC